MASANLCSPSDIGMRSRVLHPIVNWFGRAHLVVGPDSLYPVLKDNKRRCTSSPTQTVGRGATLARGFDAASRRVAVEPCKLAIRLRARSAQQMSPNASYVATIPATPRLLAVPRRPLSPQGIERMNMLIDLRTPDPPPTRPLPDLPDEPMPTPRPGDPPSEPTDLTWGPSPLPDTST